MSTYVYVQIISKPFLKLCACLCHTSKLAYVHSRNTETAFPYWRLCRSGTNPHGPGCFAFWVMYLSRSHILKLSFGLQDWWHWCGHLIWAILVSTMAASSFLNVCSCGRFLLLNLYIPCVIRILKIEPLHRPSPRRDREATTTSSETSSSYEFWKCDAAA